MTSATCVYACVFSFYCGRCREAKTPPRVLVNSLRARAARALVGISVARRANLGGNVVGDGLARETARCEGARDGDGGASAKTSTTERSSFAGVRHGSAPCESTAARTVER